MSKPPNNLNLDENSDVAVQEPPHLMKPAARRAYQPRPAAPKAPPAPQPDEEDDGFFVRNKVLLIIGGIVVAGGVWLGFFRGPSEPSRPAAVSKPIAITIPVMPPPTPAPVRPTPPPKIEPPKDIKPTDKAPEDKPLEPKPIEKPAPPPEGLGTNVKGNGPGLAGLGSTGNGVIGGEGNGKGGGGSLAKWYAGQFQIRLKKALEGNPKTRKALGTVQVSLTVDDSGKVSYNLIGTSGSAELDATLMNEILPVVRGIDPAPKGKVIKTSLRLDLKKRS